MNTLMSPDEQRVAIVALCRAALITAASMPADQRADVYDGIALACFTSDADLANSARATSDAIRDAELRQMTFAALLNPSPFRGNKTAHIAQSVTVTKRESEQPLASDQTL